jgi:hypothetical protein
MLKSDERWKSAFSTAERRAALIDRKDRPSFRVA